MHLLVQVDHLGPAAPQVRRFGEGNIAAVVGRTKALVGVLGVVAAVVAIQ